MCIRDSSEVVAWSSANVSGVPLSEICEMRGHYNHKENTKEIAEAVKNSAYEIINRKHATYYGIAMSVKRICEVIMRDETVSYTHLTGTGDHQKHWFRRCKHHHGKGNELPWHKHTGKEKDHH